MNILFVCSGGAQRSPTFSRWFNENTRHKADYAGLWCNNGNNEKLFWWADKIYVMNLEHEMWFAKFKPELLNKIKVIGIDDRFNPDDEELIEMIKYFYKKESLE